MDDRAQGSDSAVEDEIGSRREKRRKKKMKGYVMHRMNAGSGYAAIITAIDYDARITSCLSEIDIPPGERLLVDAALCGGMGQYRFVEFRADENGDISPKEYRYVDVSGETRQTADDILKEQAGKYGFISRPSVRLFLNESHRRYRRS